MADKPSTSDRIVPYLAFEVEAISQENIIKLTSTANSKPVNVKVRVHKKNKPTKIQDGIITIPQYNQATGGRKEIHLVNSDQTLMSFNMYVEADIEDGIQNKPKAKNRRSLFKYFKPGGCLEPQRELDDENDSYIVKSSERTSLTQMSTTSSTTLKDKKRKGIFDNSKPGGCLDPPFDEDNYQYKPTVPKQLSNEESSIEKNKEFIDNRTTARNSYNQPLKDELNTNTLDSYSTKSSSEHQYLETIITYPPDISTKESQKYKKRHGSKQDSFNQNNEAFFMPSNFVKQSQDSYLSEDTIVSEQLTEGFYVKNKNEPLLGNFSFEKLKLRFDDEVMAEDQNYIITASNERENEVSTSVSVTNMDKTEFSNHLVSENKSSISSNEPIILDRISNNSNDRTKSAPIYSEIIHSSTIDKQHEIKKSLTNLSQNSLDKNISNDDDVNVTYDQTDVVLSDTEKRSNSSSIKNNSSFSNFKPKHAKTSQSPFQFLNAEDTLDNLFPTDSGIDKEKLITKNRKPTILNDSDVSSDLSWSQNTSIDDFSGEESVHENNYISTEFDQISKLQPDLNIGTQKYDFEFDMGKIENFQRITNSTDLRNLSNSYKSSSIADLKYSMHNFEYSKSDQSKSPLSCDLTKVEPNVFQQIDIQESNKSPPNILLNLENETIQNDGNISSLGSKSSVNNDIVQKLPIQRSPFPTQHYQKHTTNNLMQFDSKRDMKSIELKSQNISNDKLIPNEVATLNFSNPCLLSQNDLPYRIDVSTTKSPPLSSDGLKNICVYDKEDVLSNVDNIPYVGVKMSLTDDIISKIPDFKQKSPLVLEDLQCSLRKTKSPTIIPEIRKEPVFEKDRNIEDTNIGSMDSIKPSTFRTNQSSYSSQKSYATDRIRQGDSQESSKFYSLISTELNDLPDLSCYSQGQQPSEDSRKSNLLERSVPPVIKSQLGEKYELSSKKVKNKTNFTDFLDTNETQINEIRSKTVVDNKSSSSFSQISSSLDGNVQNSTERMADLETEILLNNNFASTISTDRSKSPLSSSQIQQQSISIKEGDSHIKGKSSEQQKNIFDQETLLPSKVLPRDSKSTSSQFKMQNQSDISNQAGSYRRSISPTVLEFNKERISAENGTEIDLNPFVDSKTSPKHEFITTPFRTKSKSLTSDSQIQIKSGEINSIDNYGRNKSPTGNTKINDENWLNKEAAISLPDSKISTKYGLASSIAPSIYSKTQYSMNSTKSVDSKSSECFSRKSKENVVGEEHYITSSPHMGMLPKLPLVSASKFDDNNPADNGRSKSPHSIINISVQNSFNKETGNSSPHSKISTKYGLAYRSISPSLYSKTQSSKSFTKSADSKEGHKSPEFFSRKSKENVVGEEHHISSSPHMGMLPKLPLVSASESDDNSPVDNDRSKSQSSISNIRVQNKLNDDTDKSLPDSKTSTKYGLASRSTSPSIYTEIRYSINTKKPVNAKEGHESPADFLPISDKNNMNSSPLMGISPKHPLLSGSELYSSVDNGRSKSSPKISNFSIQNRLNEDTENSLPDTKISTKYDFASRSISPSIYSEIQYSLDSTRLVDSLARQKSPTYSSQIKKEIVIGEGNDVNSSSSPKHNLVSRNVSPMINSQNQLELDVMQPVNILNNKESGLKLSEKESVGNKTVENNIVILNKDNLYGRNKSPSILTQLNETVKQSVQNVSNNYTPEEFSFKAAYMRSTSPSLRFRNETLYDTKTATDISKTNENSSVLLKAPVDLKNTFDMHSRSTSNSSQNQKLQSKSIGNGTHAFDSQNQIDSENYSIQKTIQYTPELSNLRKISLTSKQNTSDPVNLQSDLSSKIRNKSVERSSNITQNYRDSYLVEDLTQTNKYLVLNHQVSHKSPPRITIPAKEYSHDKKNRKESINDDFDIYNNKSLTQRRPDQNQKYLITSDFEEKKTLENNKLVTEDMKLSPNKIKKLKYENEKLNVLSQATKKSSEVIMLDLAFQSFSNNKNEKIFKTLDTGHENKKVSNDRIIVIKSYVKVNNMEMNIPIDKENDMILKIRPKVKNISSLERFDNPKENRSTDNLSMKSASLHELSKKTSGTRIRQYKTQVQDTLNLLYEHGLVPLQNTIENVKEELKAIAAEHNEVKSTLLYYNVHRPLRLAEVKPCSCSKKN